MTSFKEEIKEKKRFKFGENWNSFLENLDEEKIKNSKESLSDFLQVKTLKGKSFLDVGSGSGLSSLVAAQLGASVYSFDYDNQSFECTSFLKDKYYKDDNKWQVYNGSVLDKEFIKSLGQFDIVYSWGVLHHTGNMYKAMENIDLCVKPGAKLYLSLYNCQGRKSKIWTNIKKNYVKGTFIKKKLIVLLSYLWIWGPAFIIDFFKLKPFFTWKNYGRIRGMSPHHDLIDWVGGFPFEVSKPEEIIHFFLGKNYELLKLKTCRGGKGCNEYMFIKKL